MRNLDFKYAGAWNFLPFGPEGIEFHFEKYGNIVLIRGENRDAKQIDPALPSDECKVSSNGTGKSSLQEIIVYGLFGRTVKRPEKVAKDDVVHNLVKKDCKIELIFDKYRIVRTRMDNGDVKKSTLRFWESEKGIWDKSTELTVGDQRITQKEIEKKIGLSYDAFVNMCIFTDDQRACFLECENGKKKEIVENLLALGEYREWYKNAWELRKEAKKTIETKAGEYQLLLGNRDDAERRLTLTQKKHQDWRVTKQNEIDALNKSIEATAKSLASTDTGAALLAYEEAQTKIKEINEKLPALETSKETLENTLKVAKDKEAAQKTEAQALTKSYSDFSTQARNRLADRKKKEAEIADLESNTPGTRCGKCRSVVNEENIAAYVTELRRDINDINLDIQTAMANGNEIAAKTEELKQRQTKLNTTIGQIVTRIGNIDAEMKTLRVSLTKYSAVREPKADQAEVLLEQQRTNLKQQLAEKQIELQGRSPFEDILDNDKVELDKVKLAVTDKEVEVKALEAELPYMDYWIEGFGDHGIRKWVVDGIVPELNSRVNYWLQFLIDNKITLKFDNELNETIERNPVDGDPYVYHAMSTGQRRRLNLAVSQSFAHVMTLSSGSVPSIVFLDEVSTNVDPLGVQGIYNMISELAEDKQVFVTTHDQDLMRMLQGCDVIKLVHENGYTKLIP